MPRQEAQELHNFGAEPAANFRANDNQAISGHSRVLQSTRFIVKVSSCED